MLKYVITPIHPAGWPFVGIAAALAVVLGLFSSLLFWLGVALTLFCLYFFRDPQRVTPQRQGLVVSPADGVVTAFERFSGFRRHQTYSGKRESVRLHYSAITARRFRRTRTQCSILPIITHQWPRAGG